MQESKQEVTKDASLVKHSKKSTERIQFPERLQIPHRHFIIQEKFDKLIYSINTIIKCGT